MKKLSTFAILSLTATLFASVASAQPYPAYKVLDDLTPEQVTQIKQLGHISPSRSIDPLYEAGVEKILTPEQNDRYTQLKYGKKVPFDGNDIGFNLNSTR